MLGSSLRARDTSARPHRLISLWASVGALAVACGLAAGCSNDAPATSPIAEHAYVVAFGNDVGEQLVERPDSIPAARNAVSAAATQDYWRPETWSAWGTEAPTATGVYVYHEGYDARRYPMTLTLRDPVPCGPEGVRYTRLEGRFTKTRPPALTWERDEALAAPVATCR